MHVTIKIFSFEYSLSVSNVNVIGIINCYSIASVPGNAICSWHQAWLIKLIFDIVISYKCMSRIEWLTLSFLKTPNYTFIIIKE